MTEMSFSVYNYYFIYSFISIFLSSFSVYYYFIYSFISIFFLLFFSLATKNCLYPLTHLSPLQEGTRGGDCGPADDGQGRQDGAHLQDGRA
jgi:hypothetical protein